MRYYIVDRAHRIILIVVTGPVGGLDALMAVAAVEAAADGLCSFSHAHDDCMVSQVPRQAVLEPRQKLLQQLRKFEAVACSFTQSPDSAAPTSWLHL